MEPGILMELLWSKNHNDYNKTDQGRQSWQEESETNEEERCCIACDVSSPLAVPAGQASSRHLYQSWGKASDASSNQVFPLQEVLQLWRAQWRWSHVRGFRMRVCKKTKTTFSHKQSADPQTTKTFHLNFITPCFGHSDCMNCRHGVIIVFRKTATLVMPWLISDYGWRQMSKKKKEIQVEDELLNIANKLK